MVEVVFAPTRRKVAVPVGTRILDAARQAGITVESPCNGQGTCGKCAVNLHERYRPVLRAVGQTPRCGDGAVLACQAEIHGDMEISVPEAQTDLRILSEGQAVEVSLSPFISKRFDVSSNQTTVLAGDGPIATEAGDTRTSLLGVVVDIGTTTLVVSLVDLNTGRELGCLSALNPQALHAQDVLSRISLGSTPAGLELLFAAVSGEIDRLIGELVAETGLSRESIWEVIYSGNTTMLHLAAGVDAASLGKHPYTPSLETGRSISAAACRLKINPRGQIYLPPVMSAYVGADITAGLLVSRLQELPGTTLFIDIGTNGEMAVARDGQLTASSTAAGPAFEGMNITCGMRAGPGAVERFEFAPAGEAQLQTIGGKPAVGICGSGLLDLVGALVAVGAIDKAGKLALAQLPETIRRQFQTESGKPVFAVHGEVTLAQKDVRQVQLAKAAVRSGVDLLLKAVAVPPEKVDRVLIAGSFGFHLKAESLFRLGLLPRELEGRIAFVGNTAKTGGHAFLINAATRDRMAQIVRRVQVLNLASCPDFQKVFIDNLYFKETGRALAGRQE